MKRIIICCDGTWNTPKKICDNGKLCITNVKKIHDQIVNTDKSGITQITKYIEGVGTDGQNFKKSLMEQLVAEYPKEFWKDMNF